ncbi:hypothetical protein PMI07_004345 [Rhizobium sp. CF080]|nr:hypothetical protein PMI07_004345 [Rhizobium sp. CF080]
MQESLMFLPEVGLYYRTRSGLRAFISSDVGINPFRQNRIDFYPLIGYIEGVNHVCSWSIDGRVRKGVDRPLDLVKEIPAPAPIKGWIAIGHRAASPVSATPDQAISMLQALDKDASTLAIIAVDALVGDGLE